MTEIIRQQNDDFIDFTGNLAEYSSAFHYRIYNADLAAEVINAVKDMDVQVH